MTGVIELQNVSKTYGSSRGVDDVTLSLAKGSIMGFLGPNGAGKTTTISMLVDLTRPTKGSISLFGLDARTDSVAIRKRIGFLAGDFALDSKLTGAQQLEYFANLRGGVDKAYVQQLAERLDCDLTRQIKTLSRGNKQKVGLISALMHQPELLIFDEPTSGLDPLIQAEFNKIIIEHRDAGKTAFISSHALGEIQAICDEVAFIREGKLIAVKQMSEVTTNQTKRLTIQSQDKQLAAALGKLAGVQILQNAGGKIEASYSGPSATLIKLLAKHQIDDVVIAEANLEDAFMEYYEDEHAE